MDSNCKTAKILGWWLSLSHCSPKCAWEEALLSEMWVGGGTALWEHKLIREGSSKEQSSNVLGWITVFVKASEIVCCWEKTLKWALC